MAQFDLLIISPLLWSTLLILFFHYTAALELLIPHIFGTKKFREKKLNLSAFYEPFKNNSKLKLKCSYNLLSK